MTEELSGRRIVVPETRELGQLVRMLEERGAEAIPCPMIAIRDAPDEEPVAAWLRWFVKGTCDDLVLMTGEGLRRLLGLARRIDLEPAFLDALRTTRRHTSLLRTSVARPLQVPRRARRGWRSLDREWPLRRVLPTYGPVGQVPGFQALRRPLSSSVMLDLCAPVLSH